MTRGLHPARAPITAPESLPVDETHFKLAPHERGAGTWIRMRAHLTLLLEKERNRLEHMTAPNQVDQTDFIRGRIAMLRHVLEFDKDPPPVTTESLE